MNDFLVVKLRKKWCFLREWQSKLMKNHAKRFGLALDSGSKMGCDVPSTHLPIHLWIDTDLFMFENMVCLTDKHCKRVLEAPLF